MRSVFVAVLLAIILAETVAATSPASYPGVLMCGPAVASATVDASLRSTRTGPFKPFTPAKVVSIPVGNAGDPHTATPVDCLVFEASPEWAGLPGASVAVFNASAIAVEYVSLFDGADGVPSFLDEYTDLVWVYFEHALVNVVHKVEHVLADNNQYSVVLHSHPYAKAPQVIWLTLDPAFSVIRA